VIATCGPLPRPLSGAPEIDRFVIAVTAAKGMVGHVARHQHGRTQMLKTTLVAAAAAALIATGLGVWATSPTNARAPSTGQGIDPHQMMMNASAMPTTEFADYSFVFVH
jgi:hypothetical protein